MININHVTLVGRLTKDIEIKKTQSNLSVCNFTVAVDRRFAQGQNGERPAAFINCIAWKQSADFLGSYATKGTIVSVEGRIQTRNYDGQNGKVYVTEVVAESVQIISQKNDQKPTSNAQQNTSNNSSDDSAVDYEDDPTLDIDTDDLPFY